MRLAVFASGGGSNAEALMAVAHSHGTPFSVALCASNRADAGVLDRAQRFDVPTHVFSADDVRRGDAILALLREHRIDALALAGYLKMVPAEVVSAFRHRILNIHPALLPAFGGHGMYGMHVHRAVIDAGVRWTGATVHFVDEAYDTGPIVLQQVVPVEHDDTPEVLAARVLRLEHQLYPLAVRLLAEGRLRVEGRRVTILEHPDTSTRT